MLKTIIIVGAGSCIGGVARYLVGRIFKPEVLQSFPWATLIVNVVGCFIIGIIYGYLERHGTLSPQMRTFLAVGFCGGFTTFSSFMNESYTLASTQGVITAAAYAAASFALGLLGLYGGIKLAC